MSKVLIVDDNVQITAVLREYSLAAGYEVALAHNGDEALEQFATFAPDIVLLDVMMPKKDGFEVCRLIREHSQTPIIMITARGEDFEKIMAFDLGVDDYVVKPFSSREIMARMKAVLRRVDGGVGERARIERDTLTLDRDAFEATIEGQRVALSKKEFDLLWMLAEHPGRVFSRELLLEKLWGYDYYGDSRTVDTHIKRLRAKLDAVPHALWSIETIWGVGYKFEMRNHG